MGSHAIQRYRVPEVPQEPLVFSICSQHLNLVVQREPTKHVTYTLGDRLNAISMYANLHFPD